MGSIVKQSKGPGSAGAGETLASGPGKSREMKGHQDRSNFPDAASSAKGIKPKKISGGDGE